jgi:lysophospholipase L1-like esterase
VSATPSLAVPAVPTEIKAVAGDLKATISWNPVDNATAYNIYWSPLPDVSHQSGTKLENVKSPYLHSGLIQGRIYYYVVTAANEYGESADSARVSVTIPSNLREIFVAMGASITKGYPLDNYDDCYVARLSRKWAKTAVNKGVNGATSLDGRSLIESILREYNPRYVTLYYGSNDIGYYNIDLIINNLRFIIAKAKENGTIPVVATLGPFLGQWAWKQPFATDLNKKIRQTAAEMGIALADVEVALNGNSAYMNADGMHPNTAGHQIIAEAFYRALTQ